MNSRGTAFVGFRGFFCGQARVALGVMAMLAGGCASVSGPARQETTHLGPEVRRVSPGMAMAAAEHLASQREGDFVMTGSGDSMAPVFCDGTVVVVHPTSFFMLREGMSVVYLNRRGTHVAHRLVARSPRGWVAAGVNNRAPDDEYVTPRNLIGVIRYAFAADDAQDSTDRAGSLVAMPALYGSSRVALLH